MTTSAFSSRQRQFVLPVVREVSRGRERKPPPPSHHGRPPLSQRDRVAASLLLCPAARD
jgi:hypothetical protein